MQRQSQIDARFGFNFRTAEKVLFTPALRTGRCSVKQPTHFSGGLLRPRFPPLLSFSMQPTSAARDLNSLPPSSRARSSPARRQCLSRSSSLDGHCNPLFGRRLRPAEFENSSYLDPLQPRPVLFDHLGMIFPQRVFVHIEERSPPSPGLSDVAGSFPADRASRLCD